ncbi:hypothetical protein D3C80_1960700 [compost metagenome]
MAITPHHQPQAGDGTPGKQVGEILVAQRRPFHQQFYGQHVDQYHAGQLQAALDELFEQPRLGYPVHA